jgi:multidrug efflux system outer membrane protein
MKKGIYSISFFLLCLITLNACTLYQKPKIKLEPVPQRFNSTIKTVNRHLQEQWWKNFKDPHLNELVSVAIKDNVNYQIAIKNIKIAKTYITGAASALYPQVNLYDSSFRTRLSTNSLNNVVGGGTSSSLKTSSNPFQNLYNPFSTYLLFLTATYELDVWNQIGNQVNEAKSRVLVSQANSDIIRLTLITDVVNIYFQISAANKQLDNLQEQYRIAREIHKLNASQFGGGLVDEQLVIDATNRMDTIKVNSTRVEKGKAINVNTMAYLLGQYPEEFNFPVNSTLICKNFSNFIPEGIPASMLAKRPDIRQAFFQIVAYGYLEKENLANFLPSFNLTGIYGFASPGLGNFINQGSIFWTYGANILQPILDFGSRMSTYKRSKLQFETAVLQYKQTVLNAFMEVNSALSSYQEDYLALEAYQRQAASFRSKIKISSAQYQGGIADNLSYLTNRLNELQTRFDLINQEVIVLQDIVQVYKTLGLGLSIA